MMQQPVYQQEQTSNQAQQQQQMLLCPVRLVYETQILVQPGDQIQPNQTILINQQNQPPWVQNRVQNQQVIYVQNMPNNYMPQVQQIDQNQMFLHQNYGFPQIIQHQMIAQNQEHMRALQMANVPGNVQAQMQANIAQLMPNERMVTQNFGHVQMNSGMNVSGVVQNQIANVPNSTSSRQVTNVPKPMNEMPNNSQKPQEVHISTQQNYRHLSHQPVTHQMNLARAPAHQTITMIPVPNMVHRPNQDPNAGQVNSIQQQIVQASNTMHPTFVNSATNVQMDPRKAVPVIHKGPNQNMPITTVNHAPKNPAYSYRPIQPRPQQFRSNVPAPAMTVQPNMNIQIQPNPNIVDANRLVGQNIVNTMPNYQKVENSNTHQFNRKRKSESPDELHRKLTIVPTPQTTSTMTIKRLESPIPHTVAVTKVNTHEIGVNTNPVTRVQPKISTNNRNMIQISPIIDQNAKIKEELAKPIITPPQPVKPPMTVTTVANTALPMNVLPNLNATPCTQVEKEKLVRNTVFTQARFGRLLTDKDDIPVNINAVSPSVSQVIPKEIPKKIEELDTKITEELAKPHNVTAVEVKSEQIDMKQEEPLKLEPKIPIPQSIPEVKEEKPVVVERNAEEKMLSDSMHRLKGPEATEIKLKSDKDYILTHVLDGFVIQESNVAFPIRLPLKEKVIGMSKAKKEAANPEEDLSEEKDVKPDKVPDLSHLKLSENERLKGDGDEKMEVETGEENPFTNLKHCAVKSWTVEQLALHLSKFNWAQTISVLQEHEIDGVSLFLVSKSQLVSIGVKENHADLICEFVKS